MQEPAAEEDGALPIGTEEVSLSIEETNKLRIALGLKPLDESKGNKKDLAAIANFDKEKQRMKKRAERKAVIESIAKQQNLEKLHSKLSGKGLGDESDEEGDSMGWAKKHKARVEQAKREAEARARELEEQDRAIQSYTADDLKGLRVGHDLDDIKDEILVLSDKRILEEGDDGDDELVSVAITDKERAKKHLENKSKKKTYNAYDDDEFGAPGQKKKILSHYDEDIDGPVKVGFVIGGGGTVQEDMDTEDPGSSISENLKRATVSLEYEKMQEIRDYYTQEESVAFNKPKKKKKKVKTRTREIDTADWPVPEESMEDVAANGERSRNNNAAPIEAFSRSNKTADIGNVNFVDDDELQLALSKARKLALKTQVLPKPEEFVKQITETVMEEEEEENDVDLKKTIVLSATSEFVNNLSTIPTLWQKAVEPPSQRYKLSDDEDEGGFNMNSAAERPKRQEGWQDETDQDEEMDDDQNSADGKDHTEQGPEIVAGIVEEPLVASGIAATLSLLKQKGMLDQVDGSLLEKERKQRERAKWLAEQKVKEKLKEIEKEKLKAKQREVNKAKGGRGGGYVDEWQQEEDNRQAERQRQREIEERFKNYNPEIELKYVDEFGHNMNQKEAFRYLSHKFHGKTSGKMKTEKRLLRKEEEIKLLKMMSSDTPLNTASALAERTKQTKSAHVVLSVGNRGVLPNDIALETLAPGLPLKKGPGGNSKNKGKGAAGKSALKNAAPKLEIIDTSSVLPAGHREKVTFGLALGGQKRKAESHAFDDSAAKKFKEGE